MEQLSKEWFEARRGRVTGSNVGAILGLSPYNDRAGVMRAMVREALGAETEFNGNVATEWGKFNEEGARIDFQMKTGIKVERCGFFAHEDWLGASPDGLIYEDSIWENKCPFYIRNDREPAFKILSEMPHYYAQIQIELLCSNRNRCFFTQWTPFDMKYEGVPRNDFWLNENLPVLRQFHAEFLHELEHNAEEHLAPLRVTVDTPDAHKAIEEWDSLKEQIELAQERQKDLLAQIVAMSKDRDALIAGRKLTKVERAGSVSYAKVVKERLPELDLTPWTGKPSEYWKLS